MVVYLRKAIPTDLVRIMDIISSARQLLHEKNIPQWQNGEGPNEKQLEHDIALQRCYVMIVDQDIAGLGIISTDEELPYKHLKNGTWIDTNANYVALHRIALSPVYQSKGLALLLINYLISAARLNNNLDIRIDTHPKNEIMQKLIKKAGFAYRGEITLPVINGERFAYQLVLS